MPSYPLIISYCATFLPKEMWHVYRQVSHIKNFENKVLTRTRKNTEIFPYPDALIIPKSPLRFVWRAIHKLKGEQVPLSPSEVKWILKKTSDAKLLHVYLGSEALRMLHVLQIFRGARIVSFHGADLSDEYSSSDYSPLWKCAELFLCRSESLKARLLAKGCPSDRIRLNYTGVPCEPDIPSKNLPASDAPLELFQACRFIDKKGLDITLKATALLISQGTQIHLTLAGDGPLKEELKQLALKLGILKNVHFIGFLSQNDLEKQFLKSHIFIHPSRTTAEGDREGIPNAMVEAMSLGLPVISTYHSGIPELITSNENGLLLEQANETHLAQSILSLKNNPDLYSSISAAAHQKVLNHFSLNVSIQRLEAIYREAISSRSF